MGRTQTARWVPVLVCAALGCGLPASAFGDEPAPPTKAPRGDTITPLVRAAKRPPQISPSRGDFWFSVGGAMSVTHTLTHGGRVLGRQTVHCQQAGSWRVRITFSRSGRRTVRRLLSNRRVDRLIWTMLATDPYGNHATRTVTLRR